MSLALGLVGWPIHKSRSPLLHQAALEGLALNGRYSLLSAESEQDAWAYFEAFAQGVYQGLNVTLPYKHLAARFCLERGGLCGVAEQLGVVNTLVHGLSGIEGHNTDVPGLVAAVRACAPLKPFKRVAIIGAGGAGYAAAYAALQLGATELRLFNRTPARAETLALTLGAGEVFTSMRATCAGAELVLQASSHGMATDGVAFEEAQAEASHALSEVSHQALVVDLVYVPHRTPWLAAAEAQGLPADNGLRMLVHQAALAFAHWAKVEPPVALMEVALADALR